MKIVSSRFVASAFKKEHEPKQSGREVVFLGRSNVGKSSLINLLLGEKKLARTSSTPGRTQSVNYYRVNDLYWFIDLPGYGYAKVPTAVRNAWGPMIEGFLQRKKNEISLAILLVDARHEPTRLDRAMSEWLDEAGIAYIIVATKADKLSGNGRAKTLKAIRSAFENSVGAVDRVMASATTRLGMKQIWKHLDQALEGAERRQ